MGKEDSPSSRQQLLHCLLSLEVNDACFYTAHQNRPATTVVEQNILREQMHQLVDGSAADVSFEEDVFKPNIKPRFYSLLQQLSPDMKAIALRSVGPVGRVSAVFQALWRKQLLYIGSLLAVLFTVCFGLSFWLVVITLVLLLLLKLRRVEKAEDKLHPAANDYSVGLDQHQRLLADEGLVTQSPMTSVTLIKPGRFRGILLRCVLGLINYLAKTLFSQGMLGSISSIHFAHWIIIDKGQRLLFISYFDGSWENYLGDFIDRAAIGLTAIWSNAVGFPKTKFLVMGGARNERAFKNYTRASQVKTNYWYSAYPNLSCPSILHNAEVAESLGKFLKQEETAKTGFNTFRKGKMAENPSGHDIEKWMAKL